MPKQIKSMSGFTLIELLVVVSIISILSTIAVSVYSGAQKTARDTRRREDLNAIAKVLEIKKAALNATGYSNIGPQDFVSKQMPQTNSAYPYCIRFTNYPASMAEVTANTTKVTDSSPQNNCPVASGVPLNTVYNSIPSTGIDFGAGSGTISNWQVCIGLEDTNKNWYCVSNSQ